MLTISLALNQATSAANSNRRSIQENKWFFWKLCLVFIFLFGTSAESPAQQKPTEKPSAQEILKPFLPLAEDVPREIQNPYHATPVWKLWAQDPTPVTINKPHFKGQFEAVAIKDRKIPSFGPIPGSTMVLQGPKRPALAGFFDDVYMSLDNGHTGLGYPPKQLFLHAGKMPTAQDFQTRFQLGVNFTSQSYSKRGRAIIDDVLNNLNTEKNFFFANCIRATPAHNSFKDVKEDAVTDSYDGLHAHSYHSIGQSGSEVHALSKMMIAGASMPRATKDLLKQHGAYAITLLTLFKAALPYADAAGFPLPYEHELRHRPAYSSNGDPKHKHFCSANIYFHGYDEKRHLWDMARLARGMDIAPPIAILNIAGIRIQTPEGLITQRSVISKRIKSTSLTAIRLWGEPGETLEVLVDLQKSYDLQGQDLSYTCQSLYPNQTNVQIQDISPGIFSVSVAHDQQLPKGRIPIICTVRNQGEVPSNPVFINFYWPGKNELFDYGLPKAAQKQIKALGIKNLPVTVNKRPQVKMNISGDSVACKPGDTISINLEATDPEGYPVSIYRRLDQWGTLKNGHYEVNIPDVKPRIEPIHFIFSDGTGGYTGKQIKLCIGKTQDKLESSWATSLLGQTSPQGQVSQKGGTFKFQGLTSQSKTKQPQGLFAFQMVSDDVDLAALIPATTPQSDIGILLTNSLDHFSRRAYIGFFQGRIQGQVRPREQKWGNTQATLAESFQIQPELFRIVSRKGYTGVFASEDGQTWIQVAETKIKWFKTAYAGLLYGGSNEATTCHWINPSGSLALINTIQAKKDKAGNYIIPLKLRVNLPRNHTARYTLDGSQPNPDSSLLTANTIELNSPGTYQVSVTTFQNDQAAGTITAIYSVIKAKP